MSAAGVNAGVTQQLGRAGTAGAARGEAIREVGSTGSRRVTVSRALAAEWLKVVTLPTSWWCGLAAVGLAVLAFASVYQQVPPSAVFSFSQVAWAWVMFTQVAFLTLGLVVSGAEHSCAQGRTSLLVLPRRGAVWGARVLVVAGLALATASVLVVVVAWACPAGLFGQGAVVARVVLWLTASALLGLGAGELVRSTTAAGTAALCLVVVAPAAKEVLGDGAFWLPGVAAADWVSGSRPGRAAVVLAAWLVLAVGGAAVRLARADA